MKNDRLTRWLTLTANFAVVAGIVFLAVELQQNNELLEAQGRATFTANRIENVERTLAPESIAVIVKAKRGEALTDEESYRFERLKHGMFISWESNFREYKAGFAENMPVVAMGRAFSNWDGLQESWESLKPGYGAEFVRFVDEEVIPKTSK